MKSRSRRRKPIYRTPRPPRNKLNITVPITSTTTESQLSFTASDITNADAGIIAAQRQLTAAHAQLEEAQANDAVKPKI